MNILERGKFSKGTDGTDGTDKKKYFVYGQKSFKVFP